MTRNLKALGLALLAVFALGAIGAQAASATDAHEFKSAEQTAIITADNEGEGAHEFTVGSVGTVKCTTATFEATSDAGMGKTEVDELTVKPRYSGCEFGGQPAEVFINDCAYVLDSDTTEGNTTIAGSKHANVSIECSGGTVIKVHTVNCTITVGAQSLKHGITYSNETASSTTISSTVHGIFVGKERTTASQPANGCLLFPTGAVGKYKGNVTAECFKDESLPQADPTTPVGTKDEATKTCEVTGA